MSDLDKLIEAVERGEYHRKDGPARYWDFGNDSERVVPLPKLERMASLREGPIKAAAILKAMRAKEAGNDL